jgi:hypothetical protein
VNGESIRPQPKPTRAPKERSRLRQVSPKRAARIAAGEERPGMKRGRPMRRKGDTAYANRDREFGRMAFYHSLWCMLRDLARGGNVEPRHMMAALACEGPIEVAHLGERAGYRRCSDAETAPLCRRHHRGIDGTVGGRAKWYSELGREDQRDLRDRLIRFSAYYWDGLTPAEQAKWEQIAEARRAGARAAS